MPTAAARSPWVKWRCRRSRRTRPPTWSSSVICQPSLQDLQAVALRFSKTDSTTIETLSSSCVQMASVNTLHQQKEREMYEHHPVPTSPDPFPAPEWAPDRWRHVVRDYGPEDVARLAGSVPVRHSLAENGARQLWELLHSEAFVPTLGTFTGNQAVQQVKAGLKAIYLSGWQVAADANSSGNMYPDQSLYPVDSVPTVVRRINKALQRADQIETMERLDGTNSKQTNWMVPIIADAEAGFGGALNAFELMKAMIEAGAAAVHFEDQLASEKKCGHLGGKVLVPTRQ